MLDRKGAYDDTICMQLFAVATAHEFYDKAHLMFPELEEHFKEVPTRKQEEHNDFALINTIVKAYSKFRFFLISQEISHGAEIHHDLNKLVLFDH